MFRVHLRTPEEKADLERSWRRPDEEFFASGACHVLAGVFLRGPLADGFGALLIEPRDGARGGHVIAASAQWVFDCRGWQRREPYLAEYAAALRAVIPGWSCVLTAIDDPCAWAFCRKYQHRHPTQFFGEPIPRAEAFLRRFARP
jgi:hypothetical protein